MTDDIIKRLRERVDFGRDGGMTGRWIKLDELAALLDRLDAAERELERLRSAIRDKGGTEHAPTQWAYDQACAAARRTPIDMILNCPACGLQHVDAPDERTPDWKNEPHRSHLCHGCGHIWRPADVPTNGVAAIKTKGKADSPIDPRPVAIESLAQRVPLTDERLREIHHLDQFGLFCDYDEFEQIARAIEEEHGITPRRTEP